MERSNCAKHLNKFHKTEYLEALRQVESQKLKSVAHALPGCKATTTSGCDHASCADEQEEQATLPIVVFDDPTLPPVSPSSQMDDWDLPTSPISPVPDTPVTQMSDMTLDSSCLACEPAKDVSGLDGFFEIPCVAGPDVHDFSDTPLDLQLQCDKIRPDAGFLDRFDAHPIVGKGSLPCEDFFADIFAL
jgi:hypothetical protein